MNTATKSHGSILSSQAAWLHAPTIALLERGASGTFVAGVTPGAGVLTHPTAPRKGKEDTGRENNIEKVDE